MTADSGNRGQIIWPIAQKLFRSVMLQRRPRWTGGRRIPVGSQRHAGIRPTLPWDDSDRPPNINFGKVDRAPIASATLPLNFALCALDLYTIRPSDIRRPSYSNTSVSQQPAVVHSLLPMPATVHTISGISKDSTGTPLAFCTVSLFRVEPTRPKTYTFRSTLQTDANGFYEFNVSPDDEYMIVAFDAADNETVGGVTLNNLTGVLT